MYDFAKLILSDSLSGFLKGHSCATALLKVTDDFRASLDNKDHCIAIAMDLSKAFDSISLSLLISKLKAYGFTKKRSESYSFLYICMIDYNELGSVTTTQIGKQSNMVFVKKLVYHTN